MHYYENGSSPAPLRRRSTVQTPRGTSCGRMGCMLSSRIGFLPRPCALAVSGAVEALVWLDLLSASLSWSSLSPRCNPLPLSQGGSSEWEGASSAAGSATYCRLILSTQD